MGTFYLFIIITIMSYCFEGSVLFGLQRVIKIKKKKKKPQIFVLVKGSHGNIIALLSCSVPNNSLFDFKYRIRDRKTFFNKAYGLICLAVVFQSFCFV